MNKKGQLSYEYLVVVGMILLLAIPFFYTFFRYLLGGFDNQMNADMVTRIGHATEMLANLGGVGTKFTVAARMSHTTSSSVQNNRITVTTANGQTYSAPVSSITVKLAKDALVGDGLQHIPLIQTYLETIGVGSGPIVAGACPENENPYSPRCSKTITVQPNEGFRVLGANFNGDSVVMLSKINNQGGGCQTFTACVVDSDCGQGQDCQNGICADITPKLIYFSSDAPMGEGELILDVKTDQTGVGQYALAVANPGGQKTPDCVTLSVSNQEEEEEND